MTRWYPVVLNSNPLLSQLAIFRARFLELGMSDQISAAGQGWRDEWLRLMEVGDGQGREEWKIGKEGWLSTLKIPPV